MAQRCCLLLLIKQNCLLRPILHGHFRHFLLKVGLSPPPPPKKISYLPQRKPFKNNNKCMSFYPKSSFYSENIFKFLSYVFVHVENSLI